MSAARVVALVQPVDRERTSQILDWAGQLGEEIDDIEARLLARAHEDETDEDLHESIATLRRVVAEMRSHVIVARRSERRVRAARRAE